MFEIFLEFLRFAKKKARHIELLFIYKMNDTLYYVHEGFEIGGGGVFFNTNS